MIGGSAGALMLILLAPLFGIEGGIPLLVFHIAIMAGHFLVTGKHENKAKVTPAYSENKSSHKPINMINIMKLGLATGITGMVFYIGCAIVMAVSGHDATVIFFNTVLHGFDATPFIKEDITLAQTFSSMVMGFVLFYLAGTCVAVFYNLLMR